MGLGCLLCTLTIWLRGLVANHISTEVDPQKKKRYTYFSVIPPAVTLTLAIIWTPILPATIMSTDEEDVSIGALAYL